MIKCDFCEALRENEKGYSDGWGHVKLQFDSNPPVEVTFCPKHRKEAEKKLDIAFSANRHHPGG